MFKNTRLVILSFSSHYSDMRWLVCRSRLSLESILLSSTQLAKGKHHAQLLMARAFFGERDRHSIRPCWPDLTKVNQACCSCNNVYVLTFPSIFFNEVLQKIERKDGRIPFFVVVSQPLSLQLSTTLTTQLILAEADRKNQSISFHLSQSITSPFFALCSPFLPDGVSCVYREVNKKEEKVKGRRPNTRGILLPSFLVTRMA